MKSWRDYQTQTKIKNLLSKLVWVVFASLLASVALLGIKTVRFMRSPVGGFGLEDGQSPRIQKGVPAYILWVEKEGAEVCRMAITAVEPEANILNVLSIPLEAEVSTQEGKYTLRQVWGVGEALNPPQPRRFLVHSLENYLALPLDAYFIREGGCSTPETLQVFEDLYETLSAPLFWLRGLKKIGRVQESVTSNLTWFQLLKLTVWIRGVDEDKPNLYSLADNTYYQEAAVRDKTVEELFASDALRQEGLKIRVCNGTQTPGLAGLASRFVTNTGGNVLLVENCQQTDVPKSKIIVHHPRHSFNGKLTLSRLNNIFSVPEDAVQWREDQGLRFDLEVLVGGDWK